MDIKNRLEKSGFTFSKRYGQNFITDKNFLASLAEKSGINGGDVVVEIGAGAGTLTAALAERAKKVVAFEIDRSLTPVLEETLAPYENIELIFDDFMKSGDISERVGPEFKVVANLPYYITTPVLFRLIEDTAVMPESICVMVQKEVADRLCALPSTKDYGALTVAVDLRYRAKKIADVHRSMFLPVPNVDSAVVLMEKRQGKDISDFAFLSRLVRAAFAMRRKTLVNNLISAFSVSRADCESVLIQSGLSLTVRGEALSTDDFIRLGENMEKHIR